MEQDVQRDHEAGAQPAAEENVMPECFCGKGVRLWSSVLEQGFCSEEHYTEKSGKTSATKVRYVAHGVYETITEETA